MTKCQLLIGLICIVFGVAAALIYANAASFTQAFTVTGNSPSSGCDSTQPAIAAANGLNVLTLGPCLVYTTNGSDGDWQSFFGANFQDPASAYVSGSGNSVLFNAGNQTWGGQIASYTIFQGPLYAEATFSYTGQPPCPDWVCHEGYIGGIGWWSTSGTPVTGNYGHKVAYNPTSGDSEWVEADIFEADLDSGTSQGYAATVHDNPNCQNCDQQTFTGPNGNDVHSYGMLYIPATSGSQGSIQWSIDNSLVGHAITWNQGGYPYSIIDSLWVSLLFGTGSQTPATIKGIQVWQADNNHHQR